MVPPFLNLSFQLEITAVKHTLKGLNPFLVNGKGMWWLETEECYHILDGATDSESHLEGPLLLHYWSSTLKDVILRQKDCWETILRNSMEIPSQTIIYNRDAELTRTLHISTPI